MPKRLNWLAESFHIVAFPKDPIAELENDWWIKGTKIQSNTKTVNNKDGSVVEEGVFDDYSLQFSVKRDRLDWIISPILQTTDQPEFKSLGKLDDTITIVKELFSNWMGNCDFPAFNRIAFIAVLLYPVESREAGYDTLNSLLHKVELNSDGTSDFIYQINRTIDSKTDIENLVINRLTKWSVAMAKFLKLPNMDDVIDLYSCRLNLDINNIKLTEQEIPKEQLISLFEELIALGIDISINGDR